MKKTINYSIVGFILFNENNLVFFLTEDLKVSIQQSGYISVLVMALHVN